MTRMSLTEWTKAQKFLAGVKTKDQTAELPILNATDREHDIIVVSADRVSIQCVQFSGAINTVGYDLSEEKAELHEDLTFEWGEGPVDDLDFEVVYLDLNRLKKLLANMSGDVVRIAVMTDRPAIFSELPCGDFRKKFVLAPIIYDTDPETERGT